MTEIEKRSIMEPEPHDPVRDALRHLRSEIHSKVRNIENWEKNLHNPPKNIKDAIIPASTGFLLGTGILAINSLIEKKPITFSQLAAVAGTAGLVAGILSYWLTSTPDPKFNSRSSTTKDLKNLSMIHDMLVEAYGDREIGALNDKNFKALENNPTMHAIRVGIVKDAHNFAEKHAKRDPLAADGTGPAKE